MKISKKLIVLLLAMIPAIYMPGQDLKNDFINVDKNIQTQAAKVLLENDRLNGHELQDLKLYAARKTSSGYNFIFHHYVKDFLVENDEVKLMLDFDFKERWSKVELSTIRLNEFSSITEFEAIGKVTNHEYLRAPEIIGVQRVIAKIGETDNWDNYFRIDVKDSKTNLRLRYYIAMQNGSFASIINLVTSKTYLHQNSGKRTDSSTSNSNVCCNNANDFGRYHKIDPATSLGCSDYPVGYTEVGDDYFLGDANDNISFANDPPPMAINDLFCYDYESKEYNMLHSYIYAHKLLMSGIQDKPDNVDLDVDYDLFDAIVSTDIDGNQILFGSSPNFGDMAADRFHVTHGFFQLAAKKTVQGLSINQNAHTGSIDYLVMQYYIDGVTEDNAVDGPCYEYGGIQTIGVRRTDHTLYTNAIIENAIPETDEAQAWGSYLMRINKGLGSISGIGHTDTKKLIFEIIEMLGSSIPQNIELFFEAAKSASYIDFEELCRIYKITNDYMSGVIGFSIDMDGMLDYYIKDSSVDTGNEPYWLSQMWTSPSIWNTVGSPNGPIGNPETGSTNYIHVDVEYLAGNTNEDKFLHVYFSMASLGLTWPDDWMDQIIMGQQVSGEMGVQQIGGAGEYIFPWNPPDPSELNIDQKHHVCIYARITDEHNTVRNAHCDVEGSQIGWNTNVFNSIAWRNLSILDTNGFTGGGTTEEVSVFVQSTNPPEWYEEPDVPEDIDLFSIEIAINPEPIDPNILELGDPDPNFFQKCELYLEFDPELGVSTEETINGQGFEGMEDGTIRITGRDFKIEGITLDPKKKYLLTTIYKPLKANPISFSLVLRNYLGDVVGGELFQSTFPHKFRVDQETNDLSGADAQKRSENSEIKLVPNPTYGTANIFASKGISTIDIVNSRGVLIERVAFAKNHVMQYTIDIQDQMTGMYTIRISYKDGTMDSLNLIKN